MSITPPRPVAEFPFVYWLNVSFRDLDMLGHVNNAVYASYLESARIEYYQYLTDVPLEDLNLILAELTISYKAPAFFNDRLAIGLRIGSFGTKSFTMEYTIARASDDALIATGRSVLVTYDYIEGRTMAVPDDLKQRVAEVQGGA